VASSHEHFKRFGFCCGEFRRRQALSGIPPPLPSPPHPFAFELNPRLTRGSSHSGQRPGWGCAGASPRGWRRSR
jgi:hypothetical protein